VECRKQSKFKVAGVFRWREDLDGAVDDLLLAGFDHACIGLMASRDAVREKLGKICIATEELPDIRSGPPGPMLPAMRSRARWCSSLVS
jgi:hypothetical protein